MLAQPELVRTSEVYGRQWAINRRPARGRFHRTGNQLLTWENNTVRPKIARVHDYQAPALETLTM
jgi:hypothetical protein